MNVETYPYQTNSTFFDYEFESTGPKGTIRKVARFTSIGVNLFNFGFGDLDRGTGEINDTVVSNNLDGDKILATVVQIIIDFTEKYQRASVFILGTTPARTRRYQMGINQYFKEVKCIFTIYGRLDNKWEDFHSGINYSAFLGIRKQP
jgi:hypothetical protein